MFTTFGSLVLKLDRPKTEAALQATAVEVPALEA